MEKKWSEGDLSNHPQKAIKMSFGSATTYDYLFKVIVVGDGAVGKTALSFRFDTGKFEQSYKMTIGADFFVKIIEVEARGMKHRVKLQIWDTAGQERFGSIRPLYYRGANGGFVVFDVTNRKSFINLEKKWFNEVYQYCGHIPLILLGNKIDLEELRAVSMNEGQEIATEQELQFFETSAKTGQNVDKAFLNLGERLLEKAKKV